MAGPSEALTQLTDDFLTSLYEAHPTLATSLGLHVYDGRVPDFSENSRADRARTLRAFAARLAAVPDAGFTRDERHDATLLRLAIDEELFELEDLRDVERNPLAYSGAIDVSNYVKRNYAPAAGRITALTEHLRRVPDVLATARTVMHLPVPRTFVDTAMDVYGGTIDYHEGELPAAVRALGQGHLWAAFERANVAALGALKAFLQHLTDTVRPRATDAFAIGEERFRTMLRAGEMVELDLERLLELGRRDLAANTEQLRSLCETVAPGMPVPDVIRRQGHDHPPADRLIEEAAQVLDELRAFVEGRELVTIPSDVPCRVEPTPPFARWAFAMMDTAGPFEPSEESFYYVTPPEPGWTAAATEEWLTKFDYATLRDVGIHEVYPGHYVHFLHVRRVARPLRQVLTSYSFVEGWAHDCEELVLEAGFRPGDPALRIAQLCEALLRDVRFIVAIEMHARGMRVEDAARMFVERAYLEPLPAEKEAARGTFDPGYLNYTLGKLMVRRLREDVRSRQGGKFNLREFHDALLGLGAPPLPLARRTLLGDETNPLP